MSPTLRPTESECITIQGISFSHGDIFRVVDDFYTRVQNDDLLKIPFASVHDWPEHIQRLTHFWWIRFGGRPYMFSMYNPVAKHFHAGFNGEFLTRWLSLFHDTLKTHLNESQAALWATVSERMGESLSVRNEMYREEMSKSTGRPD